MSIICYCNNYLKMNFVLYILEREIFVSLVKNTKHNSKINLFSIKNIFKL